MQEASTSTHFFDSAVQRLHPDDQSLPQILRVRELLTRGIAVHHAGMPYTPVLQPPQGAI